MRSPGSPGKTWRIWNSLIRAIENSYSIEVVKVSDLLVDKIVRLEKELLDPDVRGSADLAGPLIADSFVEFGRSGRVHDRAGVLSMMQASGSEAPATADDFVVHELAPGVVFVTYRTSGASGEETLRSSIWVESNEGWQIFFHQGTPVG